MTRLVMKFGGTSVADLERIRRVGRLVAAEVEAGHKVAVVVSAMAGKTNELVAWTDGAGAAAQGLPASDDEYDVVVASGEQVTAGLLAMTLRNMGLPARSWLGWQIPIIADDAHGRARIDDIPPEKLSEALDGARKAKSKPKSFGASPSEMREIFPPRTSMRNSVSSTPSTKRLLKNLPITGKILSSLTQRAQRSIHSRSKPFLLPYLFMRSSCQFGRCFKHLAKVSSPVRRRR